MSENLTIALIGGLVTITSAIIASIVAITSARATTTKLITQLEVKVDLLWKTYVVDAVSSSRQSGMVAKRSPEAPTEQWYSAIPVALNAKIVLSIKDAAEVTQDPYNIAVLVVSNMRDELLSFAMHSPNVNMKDIVGTIYILASRILEEKGGCQ